MTISINNEQKIRVTLSPKTAKGAPAQVEGEPIWTVESGDATIEPDPGALSVFIVSGNIGDSIIRVSADADLGPGVRTIEDSIELTVTAPEASSLGLTVEPAVEK